MDKIYYIWNTGCISTFTRFHLGLQEEFARVIALLPSHCIPKFENTLHCFLRK